MLVLAGRDARQNELLVKRYLRSNDLYVHADVHGASSLVIRFLLPFPLLPRCSPSPCTLPLLSYAANDVCSATTCHMFSPCKMHG